MSVDLRVDWCDHKAAEYAVMHWHYSRRMPSGKLVKIGVWEDDKFVGAIIFGLGATPEIAKPFGLSQQQVCELVRVALANHKSPTSQSLAMAIKLLKKQSPGIKIIVSFADSEQSHHGGIYQANNWIYLGKSQDEYCLINGKIEHPRTVVARYGSRSISWLQANVDPKAAKVFRKAKYKYVMPLDRAMRKQIAPLAKPYPKRETCGQSIEGDTSAPTEGESSILSGRSDCSSTEIN